jgi:hypothetical protein
MKHKIFYLIILVYTIFSCSKEDSNEDLGSLKLQLIKSNSFSSDFSYSSDEKIKNVKLIWGNSNPIDIGNKIGEKDLSSLNGEETVNNLEQKTTYYFRLVGKLDGKEIMSNVVSTSTTEIKLTFNKLIYSQKSIWANKVLSVSDGFIIGASTSKGPGPDTSIEIFKLDKNFNLQWSFNIDEREGEDLKEIIKLEDGTFIAFASGNKNTSLATYNTKTYGVKFNNQGKILWTKYFNYQDNEDWTFWYNGLVNFTAQDNKIVLTTQVDTTYYQDNDQFYREFTLDNNGNVIKEKLISRDIGFHFYKLTYDKFGKKYNVGGKDPNRDDNLITNDALLEKYDSDNKLLWSHLYGDSGDDRFDNFIENEKSLVAIGIDSKPGKSPFEWDDFRWVFCADLQGVKLWDFQENRKDFLYQGRDVITDYEGNTLALFFDIYFPNVHAYNTASLLKFNTKGDLIWKYTDGEDFNKDEFSPCKVFYENGEYLIFGNNGGLWLKKIRVE